MMMTMSSGRRVELAGLRFVVVEDEPLIAKSIVRVLQRNECDVIGPFASTERTFEALEQNEGFDGALLDINLGNELVYPLAEAFRRGGQSFAFLTGYSRNVLREDFRDFPLLEKPFSTVELEDFLVQTFGKSGEEWASR